MYTGPHRYKIILKDKEGSRAIDKKIKEGKVGKFTKPLVNNKQPKIYIIKDNGEIVYVGYTSQSITTRLNLGLKATGKDGYYGYKWKNVKDEFELCVFVFQQTFTGDSEKDRVLREYVEAIEAELVYMVRQELGEWPKYQNEIHFNNNKRSSVLRVANNLYKYI